MAFPLPGGEQLRIGGMVCEDMWTGDGRGSTNPRRDPDRAERPAFEHDKQDVRLNLAVARVTETGLLLIYCNQVGGRTSWCSTAPRCPQRRSPPGGPGQGFEEDLLITTWRRGDVWTSSRGASSQRSRDRKPSPSNPGLARLCRQEPLPGRGAGLSGGDSALSAVVAVDALGPERVHAVMMPSRYFDQQPRGC